MRRLQLPMKLFFTIYFFVLAYSSCVYTQATTPVDPIAALKDTLLPTLTLEMSRKGLKPTSPVLLRIFKEEKELEWWVQKDSQLVLFRTIPICAASGKTGPKRKQGDLQVPEGIYYINEFNPESDFHLSFRINYPNEADRHFSDRTHPGGDIYIHGHCASIGCVAIRDKPIELLFLATFLAKEHGQAKVPVFIFPCRMESENLRILYAAYPEHRSFWNNLRTIYDRFERKPELIEAVVDSRGYYK